MNKIPKRKAFKGYNNRFNIETMGKKFVKVAMVILLIVHSANIIYVLNNPDDFTYIYDPQQAWKNDYFQLESPSTEQMVSSLRELEKKKAEFTLYWAFNVVFLGLTLYFDQPTKKKFDKLGEKLLEMTR